jgi:hypothetical protein
VKLFPSPQGLSDFAEIPESSVEFKFKLEKRPLTGPTPQESYERRKIVKATASNGIQYEAFCGRFDENEVMPGLGQFSSNANPRQRYATHLGYGFNPADVFIGKREGGKIKTLLFFRDVGSHDTAPYYFSVDSQGNVHLIVSDVNITDNNELNVYSMRGDPRMGKWVDAMILDQRGFTSWSHPWSGSWGDTVHSLWDWGDGTYDKGNPKMGLFYVDWKPAGYGRKVRLVSGLIESYAAAIDPKSGRLVIAAVNEQGIFLCSRDNNGTWTRPAKLGAELPKGYVYDVSIQPADGGTYIVRTSGRYGDEWLLRPS